MRKSAAKLLVVVLVIALPMAVCANERRIRSPDGKTEVIQRNDCTAELRDVASGNRIATLYRPFPSAMAMSQRPCRVALAFSRDGKLLATLRTWGKVILWSAQSGRNLAALGEGQGEAGVTLTFFSDSRLLLTVVSRPTGEKRDRTDGVSVWDISTRRELLRVRMHEKTEFNEMVLSPDEKTVMVHQGSEKESAEGDRGVPRALYPKYVTDTIRLWDIAAGTELASLKGQSARYSPDGKYLIVTDGGREMVWDIEKGELLPDEKAGRFIRGPDFAADNVAEPAGDKTWNWTVFVKPDSRRLNDIACVEYRLHPTFPNPVRMVCKRGDPRYPFGLSATGWGTFSVGIRVLLKDGSRHDLSHELRF
ncbi:MAG: pYEATS domain-containing protein [Thermodesulfobacteriota bacterium]